MSNVLLTYAGALGDVTELLSGDFATPFGRSSHHQIWSEAMVVSPIVRGLLGIEAAEGGRTLRFAPALPATWDHVDVRSIPLGKDRYDISYEREPGRTTVRIVQPHAPATAAQHRVIVAPAFPADARVRRVTVNGVAARYQTRSVGDVQRLEVTVDAAGPSTDIVFTADDGTDVYVEPQALDPGGENRGLRIIRAGADGRGLHLLVDGRGGRVYAIRVHSPSRLGTTGGVTTLQPDGGFQRVAISFSGAANDYSRREIVIPFVR
jgi:hypothetical protein